MDPHYRVVPPTRKLNPITPHNRLRRAPSLWAEPETEAVAVTTYAQAMKDSLSGYWIAGSLYSETAAEPLERIANRLAVDLNDVISTAFTWSCHVRNA